jgi:hypothetical protein
MIPAAPLPGGGFALFGLQKQSQLKPPRPDKRQCHPALSLRHQLPDGGYALSGLQKRSPLKPRRPDKRQRHPALSLPHHCRMAATPYPAYKNGAR